MNNGEILICKNPDTDNIDYGVTGITIPNSVLLPGNEYIVEYLDHKLLTNGDGPQAHFYWTRVKLKGINELQWLRFFNQKSNT